MNPLIIKFTELILLVILAVLSDLKTYKIKNLIVFPFILLGLTINFLFDGLIGAEFSFLGIIIPFVLLFPFFALRMMGAGDIKLFCGIGSIMGIKFVLYTIVYSFLSGGFIALALIMIRKNSKQRLIQLFQYFNISMSTFSFLPYNDFENKSDGSKFHFSLAIACGALFTVLLTGKAFLIPSG